MSTSMFSVLQLRLNTEHRSLVGQHEFSMLRPWVQVSMPLKNNTIKPAVLGTGDKDKEKKKCSPKKINNRLRKNKQKQFSQVLARPVGTQSL